VGMIRDTNRRLNARIASLETTAAALQALPVLL
jgi:hypothetical protein